MRAVFGLVLIAGIALAGGAVYLAQGFISDYQAELARERQAKLDALANASTIEIVDVIVSNKPLRYGVPLTAEDVRVVKWPGDAIPEGTFQDLAALFPEGEAESRYVLRSMEKDEAILAVKVTQPGEPAGLTSRIEKGKRAFAIRVDVASGVSGFLRPGDQVDVYWTGAINTNLEGGGREITRLIQTNIELIAVDQTAGSDLSGALVARTVTIAATPVQIAALAQAQNTGRLSLALVGVQDDTVISEIEIDQRKLLEIEEAAPAPVVQEEKVCTIKTRRGGETVDTIIPCTN